jgi:hypothetical protein
MEVCMKTGVTKDGTTDTCPSSTQQTVGSAAQRHEAKDAVRASQMNSGAREASIDQLRSPLEEIDKRESLFNGGAVGTVQNVMVQEHELTLVRGILLEIDGECLNFGGLLGPPCVDGKDLYERHVRGWLDNHPVLRKCEVRFSGRWVHCILWFAKPVEIKSDRQREHWKAIIRAVQRSLPTDPEAPSLLALTRPIGSVNSKTGRHVEILREGEPVTQTEVLQFAEDLTYRAMSTVAQILFGTTSVSPCPLCSEVDSTLNCTASQYRTTNPKVARRGTCYHCGRVTLESLLGLVLRGRVKSGEGADNEWADDDAARRGTTEKVSECGEVLFTSPAEVQGGE